MRDHSSAMQVWQEIEQTPQIVSYFEGLFNRAGVTVRDTGEQFTVTHTGNGLTFAAGIEESVDFVVDVGLDNITNLISHTSDGIIDEAESWNIVAVLFTPMTEATLRLSLLSSNWILWLAGAEDVIHVQLQHPSGQELASHTLAFNNGRWQVDGGLQGSARRTFTITPSQALAYQRRVFQLIKQRSLWQWLLFAFWYRSWRKELSTT